MTKKLATNVSTLRDDANTAAQVNILTRWIEGGRVPNIRTEEVAPRSLDEIVGGDLYPSCLECHSDQADCLWEYQVVRTRMQELDPESTCERCRLKGSECQFAWGIMDYVKKLEDAMGRIVRHAHSQHRKTDRGIGKNEAARKGIEKAITGLSKS